MSIPPSHAFIKAMLIYPPGTTMNNLNVGSWWLGKSLFYHDYKDFENTTIGYDSNNLTEVLNKIEVQLVEWGLLEKCDDCSKTFSYLAYILIEKNWETFWPKLIPMFDHCCTTRKYVGYKLHKVFTIPRDSMDKFISILWTAVSSNRLLLKQ